MKHKMSPKIARRWLRRNEWAIIIGETKTASGKRVVANKAFNRRVVTCTKAARRAA